MSRNKISLIGAGNIGGNIANAALIKNLGDVVLFDINVGLAKGKALDIAQTCSITKQDFQIMGTDNYADITNSDVIIVTAGMARKPGMSRDDLVEVNTKIIKEIGGNIAKYSPNAFVICVTNPLDVMVWVLQQSSGLSPNKVVGMAGILDSARFSHLLAQEFNVSVSSVSATVLGGHGDSMVPLLEKTYVGNLSLAEWINQGKVSKQKVDEIVNKTRNGGAEIVNLLGNGSAYYAPAYSALSMAESYLLNQKCILPIAAWVEGKYGVDSLYMGVPAVIGSNGCEEIIEYPLSQQEKENLAVSIDQVKTLMEVAKKYM